jgi:hypothetical protein
MLPNNQKFFRPYEPYIKKQTPTPKFVPYESDSELEASDSEGSDVTRTTESPENFPDTVKFATGLQLNETGGQDFPTRESQLQFSVNKIQKHTSFAPLDKAFNIDLPFDSKDFDTSGNKIWGDNAVTRQATTSIVMLNSRDRDRNVYPTPANVTLRLPRIYTNITSMQVVQMKLLSSFLYFRAEKNNICLTINEFGRILYNYLNQAEGPLNVQKCIREGTYNINTLIAELTIQLNTPPIFFDYPGGFNQFVPLFVSTGDFGYAFNYPGDFFYDSLNRTYTAAPTRTFITTRYWATTTLGFTPSLKQTKVAYYYPVLREYVLNPNFGIDKLNTNINTSALLPNQDIYSRIVYGFEGVNDVIIQQMIDVNVNELDIYRSANTFRQSLINRYVVNYETFNNRIYIQSPSLNTSLVNLLNTQYQIFLAQQLTNFGLTTSTYAALQSVNSALLSIINAMYDYIQTQLAIYFGINFNTFAPIYFTRPNNYINIQNALNAIGVSSNYDINVISNPNDPFTTNIIEQNRRQPTVFWPNMSNLTPTPILGMQGYNTNLGDSNQAPFLGGSNFPYSISLDDFIPTSPFIDTDGEIFIDARRKAGDIIVPIDASRYTVFRFKSDYRQTLQVETMPRPTQYRYPAYNQITYGSNLRTVFDNSYSYVFNTSNANMDNVPFSSLSNIYGYSNSDVSITTNFGKSYTQSLAFWGANTISLNVANNFQNFVFYLPLPPSPSPTGPAYRHRAALTITNVPSSSPLPSLLTLFLYHDRAAFMADLSGNARNENPLHYKETFQVGLSDASGTLIWEAYAGQTYYCVLRSTNISFQSLQVQLVLWYPDGNTYTTLSSSLTGFDPLADPTTETALSNFNYAQVNDPAFIRLPVQSNLWGVNPTGNEVNLGLAISNVPIGYDNTGVSTDLTDYVGFVSGGTTSNLNPLALIRNDPISQYFFQVGSPYSTSAQSYFYTGASNFLLTPVNQSNYEAGVVAFRQYKIVQWYNSTYIPDPAGITNPFNTLTDISPFASAYKSTSTNIPISNYTYDATTSNLQLGTGCAGFSFVPSDGQWSMDKVMFRSAFIQNDLNDSIKYLGVFLTNKANTTPVFRLYLSNALVKLNFTKKVVYSSSGSVNFGFDAALGTYYEFDKDATFPESILEGFSQNAGVFTNDPADFYSIIPFDINSNVVTMRALTGALTPYPYVTDASATRFYFDGNATPNRKGMVVPLSPPPAGSPFGPPAGIGYTLSAYEQSIPIGTQILHYLSNPDILQDLSGFIPWSGPGYAPSQIYADVSGTMMIQSTDFKFYSYPYDTTTRTFTYLFSLTVDDIYPVVEATTLVGAGGNSTSYAFLGFQVVGASYQVRIKVYNVGLGLLTDLAVPATFQIPDLGFSVNSFSLTDTNGFVISGTSGGGVATTYRTPSLSAGAWIIDTYPGYVNVKSVQAPTSSSIYSLPLLGTGESTTILYRLNELTSIKDTLTIVSGITTPSSFVNIAVTKASGSPDEVFFLTNQNLSPTLTNASSRYFLLKQLVATGATTFNAFLDFSDLVFQSPPPASTFLVPQNIVGGALGSKWVFFTTNPYIWGNRNDREDAPVLVQNAWQIFYPTTKIVLRKIANAVNPITDLSGLEYPEYPHTQMFVYNTKKAFVNDISYNTYTYNATSNTSNFSNPRFSQWGYEASGGLLPTNKYNLNSNGYLVSDVAFSGYYFNSYIFNVPLLPNSNTAEPYYYLAVRNYTPSEKSQVLMRFNLPQRYDFGFVRLLDLSNEWVDLSNNSSVFNPSYYSILSNFEFSFRFSNVNFGYNPTQNIAGSNITSTGFGYFINLYTRLFNIYSSNVAIINQITSNVNSNMQEFINDYLTYVLPDYAKTRQNFTEAVTFSILWRSALPGAGLQQVGEEGISDQNVLVGCTTQPNYLQAEDDWGLGYNLGFAKADTPYATIQRAPSFFKILDDYIYLKLNVEYDMNKMDFGGKENLRETTDSTGQINGYNGKLLLNTFGNYAQTIIQNPVYFNPPILRLDKLTIQWFDTAGTLITNTECDWNAAIQFVEDVPKVNLRGKNPVIIPR